MKKIKYLLILFFAVTVVFTGCKKDDKEPVLDTRATTPPTWVSIPSPEDYFLFEKDSADVFFTNVEWTKVVYPLTNLPSPLYSIQVVFNNGLEGDSAWINPVDVFTTLDLNTPIKQSDVNTAINDEIGSVFPMDTIMTVGIRVRANVNANDVSNIIDAFTEIAPFKVTPFPTATAKLYVPGSHQGWDPETAPLVFSAENTGIYEGFVYFPAAESYEFKFTSQPDWDGTNYGAGEDEGTLDTDSEAGNLTVPDSAGYWLTCDTKTLTWEYEPQSWGVIGSGILEGDWTEDVDLVYDADNMVLSITIDVITPPDGSDLRFKFRADNAWAINLGQGDGDNELSYGGDDIPMPGGAGNYTFVLDWNTYPPTYSFTKNEGK